MWQANVFTIFPKAFPGTLGVSVIGKALSNDLWKLNVIDMKKFPAKNDRIDSPPYGGGAGMLLSPITFQRAFETLSEEEKKMRRIYFSPRGRKFTQKDLKDISMSDGITVLCGRYEGVDQRIIDFYEFEEVSIGDFVLLGGESATMVILEGCVRLLPEVVGNDVSVADDSFQDNLLEYDQYTSPRKFNGMEVPAILLSGDHKKIDKFRLEQAKRITRESNPSLWMKYVEAELLKDDIFL